MPNLIVARADAVQMPCKGGAGGPELNLSICLSQSAFQSPVGAQ